MLRAGGLAVGLIGLMFAAPATAGPWTWAKGEGQAILKAEYMVADDGFDPDGRRVRLPEQRSDAVLALFTEYGLTDQLTVQLKAEYQSGEDAFVDYEGRGPIEVGLTWQVWRDDRAAVSLYGGYSDGGEGRNAGYAAPGEGERDWEVRIAAGRAFEGIGGAWGPDRTFVDVQAARRMRQGLPDETRIDATVGGHFGDDWMVLGQAFGGVADDDRARWLSIEASLVRHFGDWSLQGGWRQTVAGRETPFASGPVIAVWRRF